MRHFLGIEIGGTKLQIGVGTGTSTTLTALHRDPIEIAGGAGEILAKIETAVDSLVQKFSIEAIGIGFGGPVDAIRGATRKSHQVSGWDDFPLVSWCRKRWPIPVWIGNDCDVAALAESQLGAGKAAGSVFYVTVGTGIGGGFVIGKELHGANRPAVAEIGHLRPGMNAIDESMTVESIASGLGMSQSMRNRLAGVIAGHLDEVRSPSAPWDHRELGLRLSNAQAISQESIRDVLQRCGDNPEFIDAKLISQAAADGNVLAQQILEEGQTALGWAIAQVITLLAPEIIVVGGGVSLQGEHAFFEPLRKRVERYVFPPLRNSYMILPAELGEEVVVHGAILLANSRQNAAETRTNS
jgi:glucokinase